MKMKAVIGLVASVLALAGGAAAADNCANVALTAIPSCAQNCFLQSAPFVGCDGLDFACQCSKEAALYAAVEPCVMKSCPESQYQAVINGAGKVCDCVGTDLSQSGGTSISGSFVSAMPATSIISTGASPSSATPTLSGPSAVPTEGAGGGGGGGGGGWHPIPSATPISTSSPINAGNSHQASFDLGLLMVAVAFTIVAMAMP